MMSPAVGVGDKRLSVAAMLEAMRTLRAQLRNDFFFFPMPRNTILIK
jgi:hypothetical protein